MWYLRYCSEMAGELHQQSGEICLIWLYQHILSVIMDIHTPGNLGFCFHYYRAVYDACKYPNTLRPEGYICMFAHYRISLSSSCRFIWRHWTYKKLVRYILSNACKRLSQFSQLSFMQYMGLCVFCLPISLVMIVRICILYLIILYYYQIVSMNNWPLFSVRSWNNDIHRMSFYANMAHNGIFS